MTNHTNHFRVHQLLRHDQTLLRIARVILGLQLQFDFLTVDR